MVLDLDWLGDADADSDSHDRASSSGVAPDRRCEKRSPHPPLTPNSTSSVPTPTSRSGAFEMTEHQIYQRLRLKLVKLFGSLAAALYEMGADPDTGMITRKQFEEATCGRLGLLTFSEASLLFSHITYVDVLVGGSGNAATFKHFSITEEEWRQVVSAKTNVSGGSTLPFKSGPSGGSMGLYHRPIRISTVNEESGSWTASQRTPINAARPLSASAGSGATFALSGQRFERLARQQGNGVMTAREARTQPAPWRQRHKPWIEASLTGDGPALAAELVVARGRPYEQTMRMAEESDRFMDRPNHSQLGAYARGWCVREGDNSSFLVTDCPTRRCEMTFSHSSPRAGDSWPYNGPKPTAQLRATRARLLALSARG